MTDGERITGVLDESVHALADRQGDDAWLVDAYRRWYALYYSMDAAVLDWASAPFIGGGQA